jgi:hypothetical protein
MRYRDRTILAFVFVTLGVAGGIWLIAGRNTREKPERTEKTPPSLTDFQALPYLSHVEHEAYPDLKGVTLYNDALSFAGLNLLTSLEVGGAHLLDMQGRILHSWHTCDSLGNRWLYSEMGRDGSLIVLVVGLGLVKMDWDSRIVWISRASDNPYLKSPRPGYHHDFEVTESGDIYILAQELRQVDLATRTTAKKIRRRAGHSRGRNIRDNFIMMLSSNGIPESSLSLYDLVGETMSGEIKAYMARSETRSGAKSVVTTSDDVFHANTVEEIPRDIAVAGKGDVLFCIRNLDFLGILKVKTGDLVWGWGPGTLEYPHHPSVLKSGNILVFDNGGRERAYSRILELNPETKKITWQYVGDPPESFFSPVMGASQRLPNGNTLITESTSGRVFEVTRDGKTTWQFLNFETSPKAESKGKRATIYRMMRYSPGYLERPIGE